MTYNPMSERREHPVPWAQRMAGVRYPWVLPFHRVEWLFDWTAFYLSRWRFLEVLDHLGRLSILVAIVFYVVEAPDRRKQKHYQAWQVINTATEKSGNGGRMEALEELNEDGVSLVAVDVTSAFLRGIELPRADLHYATLNSCDLRDGRFRRANLQEAHLHFANFERADLRQADLRGAVLKDADLSGADLSGADLANADLRNASLDKINWQAIADIHGANIYAVAGASAGFIQWATAHGAVSTKDDARFDR